MSILTDLDIRQARHQSSPEIESGSRVRQSTGSAGFFRFDTVMGALRADSARVSGRSEAVCKSYAPEEGPTHKLRTLQSRDYLRSGRASFRSHYTQIWSSVFQSH